MHAAIPNVMFLFGEIYTYNTVSMSPEPRITSLYAASKPYFGKITRTTDRRNLMFLPETQVINEYERSNENVFFTVLFISYFLL